MSSEIKHKLRKAKRMKVKIHGNCALEKLILTQKQSQPGQIPLIWMKMVETILFFFHIDLQYEIVNTLYNILYRLTRFKFKCIVSCCLKGFCFVIIRVGDAVRGQSSSCKYSGKEGQAKSKRETAGGGQVRRLLVTHSKMIEECCHLILLVLSSTRRVVLKLQLYSTVALHLLLMSGRSIS